MQIIKYFIVASLICLSSCESIQMVVSDDDNSTPEEQFFMYPLFSLSDFGSDPFGNSSQGMDVYSSKLMFQAGLNNNSIIVLDLINFKELGSLSLSLYGGEPSHLNNINCGEKYRSEDVYPLLYVSQTSHSHACYVLRLANDTSSYDMIQTIKYVGFEHHANSNYDWFIDVQNNYIYTYGKHDGLLEEREIVKFPLPSLLIKEVLFTDDDVLDSFILKNMSIYQGSRIINGLLYAPVGYGDTSYPGYLMIISLDNKRIVNSIALECGEPESIGQYKDGAIICGGGKNPKYYFIQL